LGRGFTRSAALGENTAFYSNKHYTARAFSQAFYARLFTSNVADYAKYCAVETIRAEKSEPLCDEVELDANPKTALVRFPDGRESTVCL